MAGQDTERVSVKTYVPASDKEDWAEHAEDLEMSLSEYVRCMVQAGKRGFDGVEESPSEPRGDEDGSEGSNPGGNGLESAVLEALADRPLEFDELVDVVADDLRSEVDATLSRLEEQGRVEHDRLDGGFRVTDGG